MPDDVFVLVQHPCFTVWLPRGIVNLRESMLMPHRGCGCSNLFLVRITWQCWVSMSTSLPSPIVSVVVHALVLEHLSVALALSDQASIP